MEQMRLELCLEPPNDFDDGGHAYLARVVGRGDAHDEAVDVGSYRCGEEMWGAY